MEERIKITPRHVENVHTACEFLKQMDPRLLDIETYVDNRDCGTVGCVAGHFPDIFPDRYRYIEGFCAVSHTGDTRVLGVYMLAMEAFGFLAAPGESHSPLYWSYYHAKSLVPTPPIVAKELQRCQALRIEEQGGVVPTPTPKE
jgi:hypothetical protein